MSAAFRSSRSFREQCLALAPGRELSLTRSRRWQRPRVCLMSRTRLIGAATATAIAVALSVPTGPGAQSAMRIVNRTIVCSMLGVGSPDTVRFMTASATPFQPANGAAPFLAVGNSGGSTGSGVGVVVRTRPDGGRPTGEVSLPRTKGTRCLQTELRVPLSSRGLESGPTEPFGASYRCEVPTQVLIRVRAVFERPTSFSVEPRFRNQAIAKGRVATATVVVSTVSGRKRILLGSVSDATGKASMFVARSRCTDG